MDDRDPISDLLFADEDTFWRVAATLRTSATHGLAAGKASVRDEPSAKEQKLIKIKLRQAAEPLIKAMRESGPSQEERSEMSSWTMRDCAAGVRMRYGIAVNDFPPKLIDVYATRELRAWGTDAPSKSAEERIHCKRHIRSLAMTVSWLAAVVMAELRDSKDGHEIRKRLGARQNDHSAGRINFNFGHDQGYMPEIEILEDIKAKFRFLANQLAADSGMAEFLLRECPLECLVLLERLREQPGNDEGGSLEGASLPPIPSTDVQKSPKRAASKTNREIAAEAFGKRLKRARKAAGMSTVELAEKAGMKQPAISRYEAGKRYPWSDQVARLAAALAIDPNELIPKKGKKRSPSG